MSIQSKNNSVIQMVSCPYCGDTWVCEDTELVCNKCIPSLNVDLAVADIIKSINNLKNISPIEVRARIDILMTEYQILGDIIHKAKLKG